MIIKKTFIHRNYLQNFNFQVNVLHFTRFFRLGSNSAHFVPAEANYFFEEYRQPSALQKVSFDTFGHVNLYPGDVCVRHRDVVAYKDAIAFIAIPHVFIQHQFASTDFEIIAASNMLNVLSLSRSANPDDNQEDNPNADPQSLVQIACMMNINESGDLQVVTEHVAAAAAAAETVSISSRVAHCADQLGRDDVSPALLAACVNIIFKAARYAPASTAKFFMHLSSQGPGIDPDLFLELLSNKDLLCVGEVLKASGIVQQWIFSQEFSTFHRDYAV
jgi:hypothetical protein